MIRPEDVDLDGTQTLDKRARVYKANLVRQGEKALTVAVKVLSQNELVTSKILAERGRTWLNLNHPNLLKILGVSNQYADPLFVVSEYHQHGNLPDYLSRNPFTNRPQLVVEIARGMQYLHSCGVVHGRLKTSDILVTDDGRACVADYDMVEVQPSESSEAHRYFSPEAWKGVISRPSDVYAFAMCAFEVFSSVPPWGDLSEKHIYRLVVHENVRPSRLTRAQSTLTGLTESMWCIIEESWQSEARFRPTFDIIAKMWSIDEVSVGPGLQRSISLASRPVLSPVNTTNFPPAYQPTSPNTTSPITPFASKTPISAGIRPLPSLPSFKPSLPPDSGYVTPLHPPLTPSSSVTDSQPSPTPTDRHLPLPMTPSPVRRPQKFPERPRTADTTAPKATNSSTSHYEPNPHVRVRRAASARPVRRVATAHTGSSSSNESHVRRPGGSASTATNMSPIMETNGSAKAEDSNTVYSGAGPVILAGALQSVVQEEDRDDTLIDDYLLKIYRQAHSSESIVSKFVAAGTVPILVTLLKWRSDAGEEGLDSLIPVLITLGTLAQDPITSNIMLRTNASNTIMELFLSPSDPIAVLSVWCLTRATHNVETATGLVKRGLPKLILKYGLRKRQRRPLVARYAAWCLGNLIHSDLTAELFCSPEHLTEVLQYLEQCSMPGTPSEDTCSALFLLARVSRSVKIAKELTGAGCIRHLAHHLKTSNNPDILRWSARAVGCLMRPNSGEMAKALLRAGVASGLARLPRVLPTDEVMPLGCFAFAIQRFSYAEWGGGTRKTLVDAGVVDSLLGALRNAAEVPSPKIHVELALAVSALGDVGGSSVRKEITNAGGLMILKKLASVAGPGTEIAKTCNMAVTSIAGNIFTRHAASARTALSHSWSGGCPEYQPPCPLMLPG
ncbi:hypothetical protein V5O48_006241 [Marasmius crinis-equi]|uniref:Protein kinase domain-containing protein n=1 Tax=Marasmius crinis-equi TaxID=585013 RepID=A0ABR3FKF2_9AGAR